MSETSTQQIPALALSGAMTFDNAESILQTILVPLVELKATDKLQVDLSAVSHCDSAGLSALVEAKSRYLKRDCYIEFHQSPAQLQALAHFLKVDTLLFSSSVS